MTTEHDPKRSVGRMIYILDSFAGKYARVILGPHGLKKEQLLYLGSLIKEGDGVTQDELAGRLYVDKSTAARMIAGLEEQDLIHRHPAPNNARANQVWVTERGREVWLAIVDHLWKWREVLLGGFTSREEEQLIDMMQRMESNAVDAWRKGFDE